MSYSTDQSVVLYQSRSQWMNTVLGKLGLITIQEPKPVEPEPTPPPTPPVTNGVKSEKDEGTYDDDSSIDAYLKDLDPKDWKNQDHYKVLGLSKIRCRATENQIKKSCKFNFFLS